MVAYAPATRRRGRVSRYFAPTALAGLVAAVVVVIVTLPGQAGVHRSHVGVSQAAPRRLPPYWTVRPGDTLTEISAKTGLTVAQLEALNRNVDPDRKSVV